MSDEIVKY